MKTKVTTFVGTRPEIIRMSAIIAKFDRHFDHRLVHTGQNPDPLMKDIFFEELGVRQPDSYFKDDHKSLGEFLANLFLATEKELNEHRPDAIVILGDTNSALAAIIAKRFGIAIYHLEAGNRSFDANVPEEINRRIVDHIADFNFPYSELARANLISEGIHPRKIALMGSPLYEVLQNNAAAIQSCDVLARIGLKEKEFFLISAHRQENVDSDERLTELLITLNVLAEKFGLPVLVSTHPRTRKRIERIEISKKELINFHEPFGFLDYNKLQSSARMVLSDSGTIAEESIILGFPAITIRDSMERPEALEAGSLVMSGINSERVLEAIQVVESSQKPSPSPEEYKFDDVSTRIVNFLLSTVHKYEFWNGIRKLSK
jgi:UDP-N-acetylglucosamine 2-epimerase (non-hydrolysing)